jgi:Suppressor of fused protein (SUFU)
MTPGDWISLRSDLTRVWVEVPAEAHPVCRHLVGTPFSRGGLVCSPSAEVPFSMGIAMMPFRWDEEAPWHWLATTVGLSSLRQVLTLTDLVTPERFELCVAFREPHESGDWRAFREAWNAGTLSAFGSVPLTLLRFLRVAQDVASWMLVEKETFSFWDHILKAQFDERFPSAFLTPPIAELLVNGIVPLRSDGSAAPIEPADWADAELLRSAGEVAFLQLAPLLADEYAEVCQNSSRAFFGWGLLIQDDEDPNLDASTFIADLTRDSRLPTFDAFKRRADR